MLGNDEVFSRRLFKPGLPFVAVIRNCDINVFSRKMIVGRLNSHIQSSNRVANLYTGVLHTRLEAPLLLPLFFQAHRIARKKRQLETEADWIGFPC